MMIEAFPDAASTSSSGKPIKTTTIETASIFCFEFETYPAPFLSYSCSRIPALVFLLSFACYL